MIARLRRWAARMMRDVVALWLAARDPRVPWGPKALAAVVAAYALSPIDLIPDVIPVLGLVDDLVLVPLGIALAARLIPEPLMDELRARASERPRPAGGAAAVIALWIVGAAALALAFGDRLAALLGPSS